MGNAIVLHRSNVIESWRCIIEHAHGNAMGIYRSTAAGILTAKLPGVYLQRVMVKPTAWSREEREYLLVTNERFTEYPIYIGAHDYGHHLAIYWYLAVTPPDLFAAWSAGNFHLFEQQEVHSYVTVIHRCLCQAIAELLLSMGQETSQLEANSAGFLGVT